MASKSRSTLSETPKKSSPATPKVSKPSKSVCKSEPESPSALQNSRPSTPRSINSKPAVERKSPRLSSTSTDKQAPRLGKSSELQTQLNLAQEDLKKAKEQLIQAEKEKKKAFDDLKEGQRAVEEANEKLRDALMAQKRAEENSEIDKFRAVELEQAGIEAAKKKEEEWQKELESVRNQHAMDVAALLSTAQELQRVKHELAMACDAKNQALSHADDATKIAEIHVEKAEILSAELMQLKSLLNLKLETEASENKSTLKLKTEIETLKEELEKAKGYEEKLTEKATAIEQLNLDLEAAKMAESYAHSLLEEWKTKVEELEMGIQEANKSERSVSESLESVMKQLEGNNDLLQVAQSEIATLKEKVGLLEMTIGRQSGELQDSEHRCLIAQEESSEMSKKIESLISELEIVKEEKVQALNNEKLAASSVQTLLEEKNQLITELENSRVEEEKSKKAMESLASALHEVSAEARETQEKLLIIQAEFERYETQLEDLKIALKTTTEKYESMLDDARHEIDVLTSCIEKSKHDFENSKAELEQRELHLISCLKQTEEEKSSFGKEINRLAYLLKEAEEEAIVKREDEALLKENLKEVEAEVIHLQEALKEAKAEGMKLKEGLLDKENELQSILQENENLKAKEAASIKKVEELAMLLEDATTRNRTEENGDLADSEKDHDLFPKVAFSELNGHGEDMSRVELSVDGDGRPNLQEEVILSNDKAEKVESPKLENVNGNLKEDKSREKDIEKKDFSPEREKEKPKSFKEEVDSKIVDTREIIDGDEKSALNQHQLKKKKKPLLGKIGSLLRKKGTGNQK